MSESLGKPLARFFTEADGNTCESSYLGVGKVSEEANIGTESGSRFWEVSNLDERLTQIESLLRLQSEMLQQLLLEIRAASSSD